MAWRTLAKRGPVPCPHQLLIASIFAVGLGSVALHLIPTRLSMGFDAAGIALFMAFFTYSGARHVWAYAPRPALLFSALFLTVTGLIGSLGSLHPIYLTLSFLPSLIFISILALTGPYNFQNPNRHFALGAGVFAISMLAHALDNSLCVATHGIGTHWLWHLCNATLLYLLVTGLKLKKA